jgi:predicted N-formylglutamate amidohydrolase
LISIRQNPCLFGARRPRRQLTPTPLTERALVMIPGQRQTSQPPIIVVFEQQRQSARCSIKAIQLPLHEAATGETPLPEGIDAKPLELGPIAPVHQSNAAGRSPFLLTCDHYGRLIPPSLGDLGLAEDELRRHIAWDIGIAGVAERLAGMLGAHLIAQRYSRLVIDCNRPPGVKSSIPILSEATTIPGNEGLSHEMAAARRRAIFDPYHRCIEETITRRLHENRPTVLVALHSFTPVYAGIARPWHIGTLYHRGKALPPLLLHALRAEGDLVVGDNEPYAVSDQTDYTIPVHGEARGLVNSGIEIRQDLIADEAGQMQWAERLARIFSALEPQLGLHLPPLR